MINWLRSWFSNSDEPEQRACEQASNILEMDEPMAGAGALISGTHVEGETERELEKATHSDDDANQKQ